MMYYGKEKSEWIADPFQAIPVIPPATANLVRAKEKRKQLPVIDYEKFGERIDCILFCPHSAIMATALTVEEFIKTGIKQAQEEGYQFSQIIPLQKNWIKISNRNISRFSFNSYALKEILPATFHELIEQMKIEGEKRQQLEIELNNIMQFIGDIKIVINDKLFRERNKIDNNDGELLSVSIDVNSCSGCGICAAVGENKSFIMEDETPQLKEQLLNDYSLWSKLPDTSFDTINRLIEDKDFNSLVAILLSRNINSTLTGSNNNEDDAGAKILMHLVTAATESVVQPAYLKLLSSIDETLNALLENIRKQLSDALPVSDFGNLSELLNGLKGEKISLNDVISRGEKNLKLIDKSVLKRKIDLSDELSELKRLISTGGTGTGRSRYGIILDSSLSSLSEFPYNNFTSPVILFEGSSPQLLSGVIEGHIRNSIDNYKLLRRAALEVKNKYVPSVHDPEMANLSWEYLTDEEKSAIAPVLIVAKAEIFRNTDILSFNEFLHSGYPVKVIVVDDAKPGNTNALAQSLINFNNCHIAKASLADPEYLFGKLLTGIAQTGTALFWLLAPELLNHNSKNLRKLNSLALNSRAFTQLDFTPVTGHNLISSNINIENNLFFCYDWVTEKIVFSDNAEEKQMDYTITYADWIFSFDNFKHHFKIYDEKEGAAVTVDKYIELDLNSRKDKVPVIYRLNALKKIIRYSVSDFIIKETELALKNWRALRELAGTLTEFPEKLKQKVEKEVSEKYENEKIKLLDEYKVKINSLEDDYLQNIRQKLKDKLIELSKTGEN